MIPLTTQIQNMKKNFLSVLSVFALAIILVSCTPNSPKAVAEKWLTSFAHMDYDGAKKLSTEETKKQLDMLQQFSSFATDSQKKELQKVTVTIKDVKENGDNATVTYVTSAAPKEQPLPLKKVNGKWLVAWSKTDMMNGAGIDTTGATGADTTSMTPAAGDSASAMPMDTTGSKAK
jgi:Domain of unknown function (DUF4878)